MQIAKPYDNIETMFAEGYALGAEQGLALPCDGDRKSVIAAARATYTGAYSDEFAAACLAFFLFRNLHSRTDEAPSETLLLGDYFFSLFSKFLIPIDSVPLIDAFSNHLAQVTSDTDDADRKPGDAEYIRFIETLSEVLAA
jgi:hypothetical protein